MIEHMARGIQQAKNVVVLVDTGLEQSDFSKTTPFFSHFFFLVPLF